MTALIATTPTPAAATVNLNARLYPAIAFNSSGARKAAIAPGGYSM